jgi:hypothetical protein
MQTVQRPALCIYGALTSLHDVILLDPTKCRTQYTRGVQRHVKPSGAVRSTCYVIRRVLFRLLPWSVMALTDDFGRFLIGSKVWDNTTKKRSVVYNHFPHSYHFIIHSFMSESLTWINIFGWYKLILIEQWTNYWSLTPFSESTECSCSLSFNSSTI